MVVPAVRVGKNTVLVFKAAIASDRGVLHRRERAAELSSERPRYLCVHTSQRLAEWNARRRKREEGDARVAAEGCLNIVLDVGERGLLDAELALARWPRVPDNAGSLLGPVWPVAQLANGARPFCPRHSSQTGARRRQRLRLAKCWFNRKLTVYTKAQMPTPLDSSRIDRHCKIGAMVNA